MGSRSPGDAPAQAEAQIADRGRRGRVKINPGDLGIFPALHDRKGHVDGDLESVPEGQRSVDAEEALRGDDRRLPALLL